MPTTMYPHSEDLERPPELCQTPVTFSCDGLFPFTFVSEVLRLSARRMLLLGVNMSQLPRIAVIEFSARRMLLLNASAPHKMVFDYHKPRNTSNMLLSKR